MHPTPSTSASPAPFRRLRSATQRPDGPSPSKRRKLATPAPASSSSSSFCHRNHSPDPQLDNERRASSSRVLSLWSALEDKYARRLDEDDVVDLRIGGLVKDRGVLSSKAGTWDIGCFGDPEETQGKEGTAQEDDDDEDEIGLWGSDAELNHRFNPVHVPPVRELDPEDAEDLKAFLAAEEARKALHGADDDSSENEVEVDRQGYNDDYNRKFDANEETEGSILEVEAGSALALSSTESDDELAGYDETVGEGALLWEVSTELNNCSEPLATDVGMTPRPSHALPRQNQTPAQLYTPPLSRSSMKPPNVPDIPKASPLSSKRPLLDLPPPSAPRSQKIIARVSPPQKPASSQPSPEKRTEKPETSSSRRRRSSTSTSRCAPTDSTSIDEPMSGIPLPHRTPSSRPPRVPPHDFWPPYSRSAHTPVPALPVPYPPIPNYTRESSMAPHPDAQIYIAQALQSLSYFAFGLSPPAPSSSHGSHHPQVQHPPSSPLHSPPPWPYSPPYFPHHSRPHVLPPWPYPPYPYPYPYPPAPHAHTTSLPPSPATALVTPSSGAEPPLSSDFSSSPLSGKGKGKRVSFPKRVMQSESESDSSMDSDVGSEREVRKKKGEQRAPSAIAGGRSRRDSKESSSSGTKGKGRQKGDSDKTCAVAGPEVSRPRTRLSRKQR